MTPQVDEVGPWATQKLTFLRKYLGAYTTIMKEQARWCRGYHYVDAYAGSGRPRLRDEEAYIDGSPRVALGIAHPFTSYTFIEISDWRLARLQELQQEYPQATISVQRADCNDILSQGIATSITYDSRQRGVVFLDPFRMNLEWTTIQALANTKALRSSLTCRPWLSTAKRYSMTPPRSRRPKSTS